MQNKTKTKKNSGRLAALAMFAMALVFGGGAQAQQLHKLTVAYTVTSPNFSELGLFYAKNHGLFEKYGLDVQIQMLGGDTLGLKSLISDNSDVSWISNQLLYQAILSGASIKGFLEASSVQDYELVTKSEIKDISQMAGRTLGTSGTGGIAEVLPFAVFKEKGLDVSKVRTVSVGGTSSRLQALAGGVIDAAMGHIIDRVRFQAKEPPGKFHVLSNFGKDLSHFQFAGFVAQTKVLDQRLDDLTAFSRAVIEGTRAIANDEAVAVAEFRRYSKDLSDAQLHEVFTSLRDIGMFAANGGMTKQNFDYTLKALRDANILKKDLQYADAFDTRPRDAVLKAIGSISGSD